MDSQTVYNMLREDKDDGNTGMVNGEGGGEGFDDHDWESGKDYVTRRDRAGCQGHQPSYPSGSTDGG
jgi:hypothetical protein